MTIDLRLVTHDGTRATAARMHHGARDRMLSRLSSTMIELASTRAPTALSVSEIVGRAKVHRSTFYRYSTSPTGLLCLALSRTFDRTVPPPESPLTDCAAAMSAVLPGIQAHLELYADVYRACRTDPTAFAALCQNVADSTSGWIRRAVPDILPVTAAVLASAVTEIMLRQYPHETPPADEVIAMVATALGS